MKEFDIEQSRREWEALVARGFQCAKCAATGSKHNRCTTIVSSAVCPVCTFNGHDGDSCRANLGCDKRISCVNCGRLSTQLPHSFFSLPREIQEIVLDLASNEDFKRPSLTVVHIDDSGKRFDGERAIATAAHDMNCTSLDNTRIVFQNGPFESLTLTFSSDDLDAYREATKGGRKPVATRKVPSHFPASLAYAIEKLTNFGFRYTGDSHTQFVLGGKASGVRAEVSFIP